MKNLLVFLHGKGGDKNSHKELIDQISTKKNADILSINASFTHKNGFKWFDKTNDLINVEEFNKSVEFIIAQVNKETKKRNISYNDVIFCGHSQGGFMSMHMGLTAGAKEVISLCGDFPYHFDYTSQIRTDVPIYWIEGRLDTYFDEQRKASYKILENWNCNIKHIIEENSSHDKLSPNIVNII